MQAEGAMIRLRTGSGPEAGPTQAQNIIYFCGRVPRPPGPPRTQTRRSPAGPKTVYKKARCDLQRKTPRRAATAAGTTLPQGGKPLRRVGGGANLLGWFPWPAEPPKPPKSTAPGRPETETFDPNVLCIVAELKFTGLILGAAVAVRRAPSI